MASCLTPASAGETPRPRFMLSGHRRRPLEQGRKGALRIPVRLPHRPLRSTPRASQLRPCPPPCRPQPPPHPKRGQTHPTPSCSSAAPTPPPFDTRLAGSWRVVSLKGLAGWLDGLGKVPENSGPPTDSPLRSGGALPDFRAGASGGAASRRDVNAARRRTGSRRPSGSEASPGRLRFPQGARCRSPADRDAPAIQDPPKQPWPDHRLPPRPPHSGAANR